MKRSGTTILWETLRKDPRNLCFDEPFHPSLWKGKVQNGKGTWSELGKTFGRVSRRFGADLLPILPLDELTAESGLSQRAYLRDLMQQAERTVIDEVRLWNRIPEILPDDLPVVVVHLLRDPVNWVTAQMMPSNTRPDKRSLFGRLGDLRFFKRKSGYDAWRYEEIAEAALASDHPIFRSISGQGVDKGRLPAYQKLIAFWWAANLQTRERLLNWSTGTVVNVSLSEFSANPAGVIARIYSAARWDHDQGKSDFTHVRPIRSSWKPKSRNWALAFRQLGLPAVLSDAQHLDGDALASIMDACLSDKRPNHGATM